MATSHFNPNANFIRISAEVEGTRVRRLWLVIDTGASRTALTFAALQQVGLNLADAVGAASVATASQTVQVPLFTLRRVEALGHSLSNHEVTTMNLPQGLQIDGVLGLNFLRHFNLYLNFRKGVLVLQERTPRNLSHKLTQLNELVRAFW